MSLCPCIRHSPHKNQTGGSGLIGSLKQSGELSPTLENTITVQQQSQNNGVIPYTLKYMSNEGLQLKD